MNQATLIFISKGSSLPLWHLKVILPSTYSMSLKNKEVLQNAKPWKAKKAASERAIYKKGQLPFHGVFSQYTTWSTHYFGQVSCKDVYLSKLWGKSDEDKKAKMQGLPDKIVSPFCFPVLIVLYTYLKCSIYYPIL